MKKQYQKPRFERSQFSVADIITTSAETPFNTAMKAMQDAFGPGDDKFVESVKYGEWE